MWILFKLIISLVAFIFRFSGKHFPTFLKGSESHAIDDVEFHIRKNTNKGNVVSTDIVIPYKSPVIFKLTKESKLDRFFKNLGISEEMQTGHKEFDDAIYVASDCPAFHKELIFDINARNSVIEIFKDRGQSIIGDGTYIKFKFSGEVTMLTGLPAECVKFFKSVSDMNKNWGTLLQDPFAIKTLFLEGLIWSIAGYALCSWFQNAILSESTFLDPYPVFIQGLTMAGFAAILILSFVVLLMRGSSKGHRILIESIIVLTLSLPIAGYFVVSDINNELDRSQPTVVEAKIQDLYMQTHRRSRGGRSYSYHLHIEPKDQNLEFEMPRHIRISSGMFIDLKNQKAVKIEVGDGRLHHRWYKSIQPSTPIEW